MMCDKCKKNEANVHVSKYVNGVMYEQNLCSECAGLSNEMFAGFGGFGDMFGGMREMAMMNAMRGMMPQTGEQAGQGGTDFEALGLTLPDLQQELPEVKEEKVAEHKADSVDALKAQLDEAIKAEQFEKAADLRDKIYLLEKEQQSK